MSTPASLQQSYRVKLTAISALGVEVISCSLPGQALAQPGQVF